MKSFHSSDRFDSEKFTDTHNASLDTNRLTLCCGHFAQGADFLSLHANLGEHSIFQGLLGFVLALQHCKQCTFGDLYQAFDSDSDGYVSLEDFICSFSSLGFHNLDCGDLDLVVALFHFLDPSCLGYITHDSWFIELSKERMLYIPCAEYGNEMYRDGGKNIEVEGTAEDHAPQFEVHGELHLALDNNNNRFFCESEYFEDFRPNLFEISCVDNSTFAGEFRGMLQEHIKNGKFRQDLPIQSSSPQLRCDVNHQERLSLNLENIVENDEIEGEMEAFEESTETPATCSRETLPRYPGRVCYRDAVQQPSDVNDDNEVYQGRITRVCNYAPRLTEFADAAACGTILQDPNDAEFDRMWIVAPVDQLAHRMSDPHRSLGREGRDSDRNEQVVLESSPAAAKQGPKRRGEHATRMSLVATHWLADSDSQPPADDDLQRARGEHTEHNRVNPQMVGCCPAEMIESTGFVVDTTESVVNTPEDARITNVTSLEVVTRSKQSTDQHTQSQTLMPLKYDRDDDQVNLDASYDLSKDHPSDDLSKDHPSDTRDIETFIGIQDNNSNGTRSVRIFRAAPSDSQENSGPNSNQDPIVCCIEGPEHNILGRTSPTSSASQDKVDLFILVKVIAPSDQELPAQSSIANTICPTHSNVTVFPICTPSPQNKQAYKHGFEPVAYKSHSSLERGPELVGCNTMVCTSYSEDCLLIGRSLACERKDGNCANLQFARSPGTDDNSNSSLLSFETPILVSCAESLKRVVAKVPAQQTFTETADPADLRVDVSFQSTGAVSLSSYQQSRISDTLLDQRGQDPGSGLACFPNISESPISENPVLDEAVTSGQGEIPSFEQFCMPSAELPGADIALSNSRDVTLVNSIAQYIQPRSLSIRILDTKQEHTSSFGFELLEASCPNNMNLSPTIRLEDLVGCLSPSPQTVVNVRQPNEHCKMEIQSSANTTAHSSPDRLSTCLTKQSLRYWQTTNFAEDNMPLLQGTSMTVRTIPSSKEELQKVLTISSSTEESHSVSTFSSTETIRPVIIDSGGDSVHNPEPEIQPQIAISASLQQDHCDRNIIFGKTQAGVACNEAGYEDTCESSAASPQRFGCLSYISAVISPVLPNVKAAQDVSALSSCCCEAPGHNIDCTRLNLTPVEPGLIRTDNFEDESHTMFHSGLTNAEKCNLFTILYSKSVRDLKLQQNDEMQLKGAQGTTGFPYGQTASVKSRRRKYLCPLPPIVTKTALPVAGNECQASAHQPAQSHVNNIQWNQSYDCLAYDPNFDCRDAWKAEIRRRQQLIAHEPGDLPGKSKAALKEIMSKLKLDLNKLDKPNENKNRRRKKNLVHHLKEKPLCSLDVQPKCKSSKVTKMSVFISVGRVECVKAHDGPHPSPLACEF
jgi:hypothetical protein